MMNRLSPRAVTALIVFALVSPLTAQAGSKKSYNGITEDAALDLLVRTVKHDNVYAKRISLDCVTYTTEETTRTYFEFALRENHNAKCGGDPDVSPIIDRYRVNRASGKIELYDAPSDRWQSYQSAKSGH
ncbi:MAG TPA: hypothetical protein VKS98_03160 [Chthoniobacterales bacterium]|nr:hypothetical protein [Chthoniobacterales bacterium]